MNRKKAETQVVEKTAHNLEVETENFELKWIIKHNSKSVTQEERIREASKPLYLKRYE